MDNLVIFSVVKDCVKQKENVFQIPKAMPKCTGKKCICAWFWLADQVSTPPLHRASSCSEIDEILNSGVDEFLHDCIRLLRDRLPPRRNTDRSSLRPGILPSLQLILFANERCEASSLRLQQADQRRLERKREPTRCVTCRLVRRLERVLTKLCEIGYHDSWSFFDGAQNDIFLPPGGSIGGVPVARINGVPTGSNIVANSTISLPPPPPVESSGPISSIPSYSPSPRQPSQQAPSSRSTSTRHVATLAVSLSSTTPTPSSTVTSQKTQLARLAQASSDSYDEESASILYPLQPATISDTTSAPPARPTTSQDTLRITTRPKKEIGLEGLGEGYGPATTTSTTERSAASPTTTSSSPPRHSPPPSPPSPAVVSSLAGAAPSPPLPSSTTAPLPDTLRADNPLARVNLVSSALGGRNGDFFVPFFCAGFALVFVL